MRTDRASARSMRTSTRVLGRCARISRQAAAAPPSGSDASRSTTSGPRRADCRIASRLLGGLADHPHVGLGVQERAQPGPHERVAVHDQHVDALVGAHPAALLVSTASVAVAGVQASPRAVEARPGAVAPREQHGRLRAPGDAQLLERVREVVLHRLLAEPERVADLLVGLALRHQPEHAALLGRQREHVTRERSVGARAHGAGGDVAQRAAEAAGIGVARQPARARRRARRPGWPSRRRARPG